jgi:hypothetical protein
MTRRRSHRVPREVLDLFEADDGRGEWTIREHRRPLEFEADGRGTWTVREHRRQGWRPVAKFVGTALAWAALTFGVLLLWLHH